MRNPADEYRHRLESRQAVAHRLGLLDARLSYSRLAVFAIAVALAVGSLRGALTPWLLLAPVVGFVILVQLHSRALRQQAAVARAVLFYERGLARIGDQWVGIGESGDSFADDHHPYANDLDLFGRGSLFQLLSIAATTAGEETLAQWLKRPAARDEVLARQQAIEELRQALDLRESLARAAFDVRSGVHTEWLLAWAEKPRALSPLWLMWVARLFTAFVVVTLVAFVLAGDVRPLLAILIAQSLFVWLQLKRIVQVLHGAEAVTRDLETLSRLISRIETETFRAPLLQRVQDRLRGDGASASRAVRALHRLAEIHQWQHNNVFLMLSLPFMLGTHLAWAIEAWRARNGPYVRRWLDAAGEFEALSSLSAYHYEHPSDPFPEITSGDDGQACFEGRELGHPLLPASRIVRNDVVLNAHTRLFIVSGSNMSGKSTLLRTVGINAVLAFTGAPVRAAALQLSPLAIGATLRIQDSLLEGRSRFYAEITRIRELADLANGPCPLLFLLDELFHGTNSHDRLVGASGVLRSLLQRGAIGLITTHDLALTAIADNLGAHAANVHFEEWFDAGDMRFDYRLKSGRVTRSNALALMRAVGLEVDSDG